VVNKRPPNKDGISYRIEIRIVQANLEVLKRLQKIWGGKIYHRKLIKRNLPAHDLVIRKKLEVQYFIESVYPYLIVKKNQVDKTLKLYKLATKKNYF
jgi:hypothetical protein